MKKLTELLFICVVFVVYYVQNIQLHFYEPPEHVISDQLLDNLTSVADDKDIDNEHDLMRAIEIPFKDSKTLSFTTGADQFPAFEIRPGSQIKQPLRFFLPERLYDEFSIVCTTRTDTKSSGFLFAVLNPLDTIIQLGVQLISESNQSSSRLDVYYVSLKTEKSTQSKIIASFPLDYFVHKWIHFTLRFSRTNVSLVFNCTEIMPTISHNRNPLQLGFDSASTLYIGQAGPKYTQFAFDGAIEELKLIRYTSSINSICEKKFNGFDSYDDSDDDDDDDEMEEDDEIGNADGLEASPLSDTNDLLKHSSSFSNKKVIDSSLKQCKCDCQSNCNCCQLMKNVLERAGGGGGSDTGVLRGEKGERGEPGPRGEYVRGPPGPPGPPGTVDNSILFHDFEILKNNLTASLKNTTCSCREPESNLLNAGYSMNRFNSEKGDRGDQGEQGEKGDVGLPGLPGRDGKPGQRGPTGPPGPPGERGLPGPAEYANLDPSWTSETGYKELVMNLKMSMRPEKGEKGENGLDGSNGLQGAPGPKGDRGSKGEPGIDGRPGLNGRPGEPGLPGQSGAKGDRGLDGLDGRKGDRGDSLDFTTFKQFMKQLPEGPQGPPGPQGLNGQKGERGEIGPKGECNIMKIKGEKGERGVSNTIVGKQGPPGPPGPPGLSLTGQKGEPGEIPISEKQFNPILIFTSKPDLLTNSKSIRIGTLALINDPNTNLNDEHEQLFIRVTNGWRSIPLGPFIPLIPKIEPNAAAATTYELIDRNRWAATNPISSFTVVTNKHKTRQINGQRLRLIAINQPQSGKIGGIRGADNLCYRQAKRAKIRGSFRALLASVLQNLNSIVHDQDRFVPIVNLHNELLFNSWHQLFTQSNISSANLLYTFNGKTIRDGNAAVWHGSLTDGTRSLNSTCDAWQSQNRFKFGFASSLENGRPHGLIYNSQLYACNSRLIVLCIENVHDSSSITNFNAN